MRLVVMNHLTLDGIMQGPGRPGEDTRDGFTHSGWAAERAGADAIMRAWGQRLAASSGYLLGRRTYQDVLGYWNTQDSPFREGGQRGRCPACALREFRYCSGGGAIRCISISSSPRPVICCTGPAAAGWSGSSARRVVVPGPMVIWQSPPRDDG